MLILSLGHTDISLLSETANLTVHRITNQVAQVYMMTKKGDLYRLLKCSVHYLEQVLLKGCYNA